MTDKELLNLLRSDPDAGLKQLIRRYSGFVYAIAKGSMEEVCDSSEIEDCVADVFIRFNSSLPSFRAEASIKTYLGVIARNTVANYLLKHRLPTSSIDADDHADIPDPSNLEDSIINMTLNASVIEAVKALGHPDSDIIFRKYFLGHSSKVIAADLNMTVTNVDTRSSRAIAKLRKNIK